MSRTTPQETWELAQQRETEFWRDSKSFDQRMEQVIRRYAGALAEAGLRMTSGARILDVGSGPTCAARLLPRGDRTYLDPLMPLFLETHGRHLPVEGYRLRAVAEDIPRPDASFDCVVCLDVLDQVLDPQQSLAEFARVLKNTGVLLIGTATVEPASAALRSFFDSWCARVRPEVRPRYLTVHAVERMLGPRFAIEASWHVHREEDALLPSLHCDTWAFLCRPHSISVSQGCESHLACVR
jgi:ubiquinone/menaquinone biosynthesis C-methylase UbiE